MPNDDKKLKVLIPEELFDDVTPARREELRADVERLFEGFDPNEPIGDPCEEVPSGTTHCPNCGDLLEVICRNRELPTTDEPIDIFDCVKCDKGFVAASVVH